MSIRSGNHQEGIHTLIFLPCILCHNLLPAAASLGEPF